MKKRVLSVFLIILLLSALTVFASAGAYSEEEGILSSYYTIDRGRGFLGGVTVGTDKQKLLGVCLPESLSLSGDKVATGAKLTAGDAGTLTVIVTGDVNGDGAITITDMLMVKTNLLGTALEPAAQAASDVNGDGKVTITDFLQLKSHLLELSRITGLPLAGAACSEPLTLLQPGQTTSVSDETAASYLSQNDGIAAVDEAGTVTAAAAGCCYVYALDAEGEVIGRTLITVLNEPVEMYVSAASLSLQKGASQTLAVSFNHPVSPKTAWTSADPAIASVDENGRVTGVGFGKTEITVSAMGLEKRVAVTVMPEIKSITPGAALYKVKPGKTRQITVTVDPAESGEELVWSSSDESVATVDANGVVTGKKNGTVTITAMGKYSKVKGTCKVKVCDLKQVAFGVDDGPSVYTKTLLDYLESSGNKVTFFLVGDRMTTYKDTLKREAELGCELGYHSYGHENQTNLSSDRIKSDYNKALKELQNITGQSFTVWRTPYGSYDSRVLSCVPLPHIYWSVDTNDWSSRNADAVYSSIKNNAKDGSIILIHDLYNTSVNGLIRAMKEMVEGDYEFVTVTELLSRNGTAPEAGKNYSRAN